MKNFQRKTRWDIYDFRVVWTIYTDKNENPRNQLTRKSKPVYTKTYMYRHKRSLFILLMRYYSSQDNICGHEVSRKEDTHLSTCPDNLPYGNWNQDQTTSERIFHKYSQRERVKYL